MQRVVVEGDVVASCSEPVPDDEDLSNFVHCDDRRKTEHTKGRQGQQPNYDGQRQPNGRREFVDSVEWRTIGRSMARDRSFPLSRGMGVLG